MTRGKHAKTAAVRDRTRAVDAVVTELAALTDEQDRHAAAKAAAGAADADQVELQRLELIRDRVTAAELAALNAEIKRLEAVVVDVEAARVRVSKTWDKLTRAVLATLPGRGNRVDLMMAILGLQGEMVTSDHARRASPESRHVVLTARGERARDLDDVTESIRALGLDPLDSPETAAETEGDAAPGSALRSGAVRPFAGRPLPVEYTQVGRASNGHWVIPADRVAAERLCEDAMRSNALSATKNAAFMWYSMAAWLTPPVSEPAGATSPLGHVAEVQDASVWGNCGSPVQWPDGTPSPDDCWARDAVIAKGAGRLPVPWSPHPRFPRPGDSTLLRHLYVQQLTGSITFLTEYPLPKNGRINDEESWAVPVAERAPIFADTRRELARAVPFWMPPGETERFAASEPLDDESVAEIELPFPSVLIVPSEPMIVEPFAVNPVVADKVARLDRSMAAMHNVSAPDLNDWADPLVKSWTLPFMDVLGVRGGIVEGVLVRAGRHGQLDDRFAWCVAIPHADKRRGVLGRAVIPALLSRTEFADTVRQLAAAVAWADWHTPSGSEPFPLDRRDAAAATRETGFSERERTGGAGGVHVLNVSRTYAASASSTANAGDGPVMAPHLRRAHWRRTRVGTRADWAEHRTYRRTRIAATVVNAGLGATFSAQVYRLKSASPQDAGRQQQTL